MSNFSEEEIDFVINCPVDAYAEDDVLTWCADKMREERLNEIANRPILIEVPIKPKKRKENCDMEIILVFLMFLATLLFLVFGK